MKSSHKKYIDSSVMAIGIFRRLSSHFNNINYATQLIGEVRNSSAM